MLSNFVYHASYRIWNKCRKKKPFGMNVFYSTIFVGTQLLRSPLSLISTDRMQPSHPMRSVLLDGSVEVQGLKILEWHRVPQVLSVAWSDLFVKLCQICWHNKQRNDKNGATRSPTSKHMKTYENIWKHINTNSYFFCFFRLKMFWTNTSKHHLSACHAREARTAAGPGANLTIFRGKGNFLKKINV